MAGIIMPPLCWDCAALGIQLGARRWQRANKFISGAVSIFLGFDRGVGVCGGGDGVVCNVVQATDAGTPPLCLYTHMKSRQRFQHYF